MVGVFRRSISFPNKSPAAKPSLSCTHHVRSISLPCRSHPLIFQLNHQISNLKSWSLSSEHSTTQPAWFSDALNRLRTLLNHLHDVLNLPHTQQSLPHPHPHPHSINNLLQHILHFVDAYGIFHTLILSLREDHSAAQIAIRRSHQRNIAIYLKSRSRFASQIAKLVSSVKKRIIVTTERGGGAADLGAVIEEVVGVTAAVSVALFDGIGKSFARRKALGWRGLEGGLRKKKSAGEEKGIPEFREIGRENLRELKKKGKEETKMAMKRMRDLEDWISDIEIGSQKVFRSLIGVRVSLLNTLSQQQLSEN